MLAQLLENELISKKGYRKYKFEEIAFSISERVEPQETNLEIYVGLEHIDPESVHIKRFGTPSDVEGTKLKVYPGDLIFGKRRAYQRKAAIANFEGICSAHAMVLRANPEVIVPELFPFFIHSDQFMHRAIDISVGSLSPTINWGTLKTQEFFLPPKTHQLKLLELLWAGDNLLERYIRTSEVLENIYFKLETRLFKNERKNKKLRDVVVKTIGGGTPDTKKPEYYHNGTVEWITTSTMNTLFKAQGEKQISELAIKQSAANLLEPGNLIVGTRVGIGKCCINDCPITFSQDVTGLVIDKTLISNVFLALQILSKGFQNSILSLARGTTIKGILKEDLLNTKIFVPSIAEQIEIVNKFMALKTIQELQQSNRSEVSGIQKQLINKIFDVNDN